MRPRSARSPDWQGRPRPMGEPLHRAPVVNLFGPGHSLAWAPRAAPRRRLGLRGLSLLVLLLAPSARGAGGVGGVGQAPAPNARVQMGGVQGSLRAATATARSLSAQVQQLVAELQALLDAKPKQPGTSGMHAEAAKQAANAYQKALQEWEQQLRQLTARIEDLQQKLGETAAELARLRTEGTGGRARDADRTRAELERERQQLGAALASARSRSDPARAKVKQPPSRLQTLP